jgi:SAM-dependent methyltransferase
MSQRKEYNSTLQKVTEEVKEFYERYPYPRPIDNLDKYRQLWRDRQRRRADYHLFWPAASFKENHSILVAGCGTSQAAKYALRWPGAQVTGIDVSANSIQHSEQLKQKHGLDNLQIIQLPIERVGELGESFNCIVCTGVLHHLSDPDAGLKALRQVLKPEGAMHLMVYAPYGRTGIYMLQEFCRRLSIHAADDEIADLIAALRVLPPGHPLEHLLREAPDFQQNGELADALLHPQDRSYSVPQLFDFIQKAGLLFGRWIRQAPYSPYCGIMASIPQSARLLQLSLPEQYAAVELFRGTMVRHNMTIYRSDIPGGLPTVTFDGDACLNYIPIRLPDTICVQERLPPDAAAVLINRTHTYKDLYMPIDEQEKKLLDAIDGECTIGEIVRNHGHSDTARNFFERLWWYDQVVFKTYVYASGEE